MAKARATLDRRVRRTRQALVGAFNGLLFERGYAELSVDELAERAHVGRSTFYEHYRGKDAILSDSLKGALGVVADSVGTRDNTPELARLLDHFWDKRSFARAVLTGRTGARIRKVLIDLIAERLALEFGRSTVLWLIPRRLVAIQLGESLLATLTAWLVGEAPCRAQDLAMALRRVARSALEALATRK